MEQKNTPVFMQLLFLGLFLLLGSLVFSFLGIWLGQIIWPEVTDLVNLVSSENLSDDEINYLRFIQMLSQFLMFVLPALLLLIVVKKSFVNYFLFDVFPDSKMFFQIVALVFLSTPLIGLLTTINQMLVLPDWLSGVEIWMKDKEHQAEILTNQLAATKNLRYLGINLFVMALLPAIAEELVFRGVLLRIMIKSTKKVHLSIFLVAVLFSAIHFQFYGFLPRLLLGMILGYLLYWTSSMWAPVLFHFTNNAIAVVAFYLSSSGKITSKPDELGSVEQSWWFLIFIPFFVYLVYYLNKTSTKKADYTERILTQ